VVIADAAVGNIELTVGNQENRVGPLLAYKQKRMNIFSALKVLRVTAIVVAPAIIGQVIWPSHTKWGFRYSLGFSLIGGLILGLLVEKFLRKRKSPAAHPL